MSEPTRTVARFSWPDSGFRTISAAHVEPEPPAVVVVVLEGSVKVHARRVHAAVLRLAAQAEEEAADRFARARDGGPTITVEKATIAPWVWRIVLEGGPRLEVFKLAAEIVAWADS